MKSLNGKALHTLQIVSIILLGFFIFGKALDGAFLYDDVTLVKENSYIKSWSNFSKAYHEDIGGGAGVSSDFKRPIQMFSYMLDYTFWRLNPKGYHVTNILLHILASLCVFWLLLLLCKEGDRYTAWLASLFFLIHPLQTETVAYISGRADSLAAIFLVLCFIFYIKQYSWKSMFGFMLVLVSFLCALLSKECSVILSILLLLYGWIFKQRLLKKEFFFVLALTCVYAIVRLGTGTGFSDFFTGSGIIQRLPGFFVAMCEYARLLFVPFDLHMAYGQKVFSFLDPRAIVGIIIVLALGAYAFRIKNKDAIASFSVCWFLATLIPQANVFYPVNAFMAEHWLYLPLAGFSLFLAHFLMCLYSRRRIRSIASAFIVFLMCYYSFLSFRQTDTWKDPVSFYTRTLRFAPDNWQLYYNLGMSYEDKGDFQGAVVSYKKVLEIQPGDIDARCHLSALYQRSGKNDAAIRLIQEAISLNPGDSWLYYQLGNLESAINEDAGIGAYREAIRLNPYEVSAYVSLGKLYKRRGQEKEAAIVFNKAIQILTEAIKLDPFMASLHNNLALVYYDTGQYHLALKHYTKAIELGAHMDPELLRLIEEQHR